MKKKVSIIGTNGIPAKYGGFETLAEYLAKYLNEDYELFCFCSKTQKSDLSVFYNTKLIYLPFKANGWQSIVYDSVSIIQSLFKHDVLILLGYTGFFALPLRYFFRKKIILNIGGIEWKKIRAGNKTAKLEILVKKFLEKISIKMSDIVVADNQVIFDYVESEYNMNPVLIEYGGDHAVAESTNKDIESKYPFILSDYDLTISRAQEDMNIHLVIEAYKSIPGRTLVVISNWNITEYGVRLKKENQNEYKNIILLDAIYDLKVLNTIRSNCKVYLHTHSLCGTAPSLVEAMSLKLPVICLNVPTNRATTEEKSYYFDNAESLVKIMNTITSQELNNLKEKMYEIASRRYTWKRIANLYKNCIEEN